MVILPSELGNSQDLVGIDEIKDNTLLLKNGGLRQILMVSGVNVALKSEEEQGVLTLQYQNFLNGLDFPLQMAVHSRKVNIENYLHSLQERKKQEASPLLQNQIEEYEKFIRDFVQENAIMEKIFFVIIPFAPVVLPSGSEVSSFLPFFKKSKDQESREKEQKFMSYKESLAQIAQRVNHVIDGLHTMGLEVRLLNNEELIELFYNYYNPETIEKEKVVLPPEAISPPQESGSTKN